MIINELPLLHGQWIQHTQTTCDRMEHDDFRHLLNTLGLHYYGIPSTLKHESL